MKSLFTLFCFCLLLFGSINVSNAQSVVLNNPLSFTCFGNRNFSLDGQLNGRNKYTSDYYNIQWTGTVWEIKLGTTNVMYTTTTNSSPNPPTHTFASSNGTPWTSSGGCGNDLTVTGLGTQTFLPVELTEFNSLIKQGSLILYWNTVTELNNEKFEIEESSDGQVFRKLGEVEGNGTTLEQQEYSFKVKAPQNGISFYRLKQIDFDGQFEYSKVISVNFEGNNGQTGEFYPNPSKSGLVNLDYFTSKEDEITVSLFDMTGKLVVNQILQVSNGENNLSFDFTTLNTGIYIVKIGDERNSTHRKLIIKR